MSSSEENPQTESSQETERQTLPIGSTGLAINLTYVKSLLGIFEAVMIILSLICWICSAAGTNIACDYSYGSNYGYFNFVAGSVFITDLINYLIFAISIDEKWCMRLVPWLVWHFIVGVLFTFLLFVASIVMVTHICGQGGYAAAAVFGFITTIVSGVDTFFCFLALRRDHAPTDNKVLNMLGVPRSSSASPESPQYDSESVPDPAKY